MTYMDTMPPQDTGIGMDEIGTTPDAGLDTAQPPPSSGGGMETFVGDPAEESRSLESTPFAEPSEQTGAEQAPPDDLPDAEEKPKRRRTVRKKTADAPEEDGEEPAGGQEDVSRADFPAPPGGEIAAALDGDMEREDAETAAFLLEESAAASGDLDEDAGLDGDPPDMEDGGVPSELVPVDATGDAARSAPLRRARAASRAGAAAGSPAGRSGTAKKGNKKGELNKKPLTDKPRLSTLNLNELDRGLSEEERSEWNEIYASYRSQSVMTGRIVGVDPHSFNVRNRETGLTERRRMLCAVVIPHLVKILIPETEMWIPGRERPTHVMQNMTGAEIDFVILDVDREGEVAIASRRMGAAARRHFFDTVKNGHEVGERLNCRVLAVGPKRCLVECGGRDVSLTQRDLTYTATPDLRKRYHPGQLLDCVLKEYSRRDDHILVSVKEATSNPFFGAIKRHALGSRRQAQISGKYGGGVFCTLTDDTVCLCHYSAQHSDRDFREGDTVILVIIGHDHERNLIYGRILSKW